MIALGVDGLISKRDRIDLIHVAIVTALARECYLGPAVRALIADATVAQRLDFVRELLSRRELEVLTQYASGIGVTEIAARLGRSVKTISAQKCTAMRKLALHSDAELFRFAVEHGCAPKIARRTGADPTDVAHGTGATNRKCTWHFLGMHCVQGMPVNSTTKK